MILIREATPLDIPQIVVLGMRLMQAEYAGLIEPDEATCRVGVAMMVDNPAALVLVAEDENGIFGTIGLMRYTHPMSGADTVTEVFWWMNEDQRGHGVALFRRGIQWAKAQGVAIMQAIAPSPEVERVYMALGFRPVERSFQRRLR